MLRDRVRWLIAARDDDQRNVWKRCHAGDHGGRFLQCGEVIGHRSRTFRLAPEFLHHRRTSGGSFRTSPTSRSRVRAAVGPKILYKVPRNAGGATGQKRETCANDPESRQNAADARQLNAAPQQAGLLSCDLVPFAWRIEQYRGRRLQTDTATRTRTRETHQKNGRRRRTVRRLPRLREPRAARQACARACVDLATDRSSQGRPDRRRMHA